IVMNAERYKRQEILSEIGEDGQKKLSDARVLCIGAGGLGSPALLYMAAAGIGHIGIADFDIIDLSNLQRQILYTTDMVDSPKASQAMIQLQALSPDIEIIAYGEDLNTDNVASLFENYYIILDGTDNFDTRFLINDAAVKYNKTWVYGAIL